MSSDVFSMQIKDEAPETNSENSNDKDQNPWIGVVPVQMEEGTVSNSNNNQESFAASVVNKVFKRDIVTENNEYLLIIPIIYSSADEASSCFGRICFDHTGLEPEHCQRGKGLDIVSRKHS